MWRCAARGWLLARGRRVAGVHGTPRAKFGLWTIAALHPVNALALGYASLVLARRSTAYWSKRRTDAAVARSDRGGSQRSLSDR